MPNQQNFISEGFFSQTNQLTSQQENELASLVSQKSGFTVKKLINRSKWWDSDRVGALHFSGTINQQPAILKIQLVKPNVSEIQLIKNFAKQNRSKLIRPPEIYFSLPWNKKDRFEAFIIEDVGREKTFPLPNSPEEIKHFFELYQEYKQNCYSEAWLEKPAFSLADSIKKNFAKWQKISQEIYPDHINKQSHYQDLINTAVSILVREYQAVDWQWQHGHFSMNDLYKKGDQYVLLSNLYWSWRAPYYDVVFGFQWHLYHLANLDEMTAEKIDEQTKVWKQSIEQLPYFTSPDAKKLLLLAELERAAAGLNLDVCTVREKLQNYALDSTAQRIKQLLIYFDNSPR